MQKVEGGIKCGERNLGVGAYRYLITGLEMLKKSGLETKRSISFYEGGGPRLAGRKRGR